VQGEDCNTRGDGQDDEVFVERVALAEKGDLEEHDREKLAGFCEDESYIVDMGERCVTKW